MDEGSASSDANYLSDEESGEGSSAVVVSGAVDVQPDYAGAVEADAMDTMEGVFPSKEAPQGLPCKAATCRATALKLPSSWMPPGSALARVTKTSLHSIRPLPGSESHSVAPAPTWFTNLIRAADGHLPELGHVASPSPVHQQLSQQQAFMQSPRQQLPPPQQQRQRQQLSLQQRHPLKSAAAPAGQSSSPTRSLRGGVPGSKDEVSQLASLAEQYARDLRGSQLEALLEQCDNMTCSADVGRLPSQAPQQEQIRSHARRAAAAATRAASGCAGAVPDSCASPPLAMPSIPGVSNGGGGVALVAVAGSVAEPSARSDSALKTGIIDSAAAVKRNPKVTTCKWEPLQPSLLLRSRGRRQH